MNSRVRLIVISICAAAAFVGARLFVLQPKIDAAVWPIVLGLALLGFVADLLSYALPQGGEASVAFIPYIAAPLVAADWSAAVAVALASFGGQIVHRRQPFKALFNVTQSTLAIACGALVFRGAGGVPLSRLADAALGAHVEALFPGLLLLCVVVLVNSLSVSLVISASERVPLFPIWKSNTLNTGPYYLVAAPVALALGWTFVHIGAVGASLMVVPMLGVHQLFVMNIALRKTNQELLELMVKSIEARDPYTSGHSRRVSRTVALIAQALGLSSPEIERARIAGLLHDVGKIHESFAAILQKPGRLTAAEWETMQTHPSIGAELISTVSHLSDLVPAIRHHHENWNGTGYPAGLVRESIPLYARIITFADTLDALMSDRPYRPALGPEEAKAEFVKCRGTQFDPDICDVVLRPDVWERLISPMRRATEPTSGAKVLPWRIRATAG